MIFQSIFGFLFGLLGHILNYIPKPVFISLETSGIADIMGFGIWVVGESTFMIIVANILFWSTTHLAFGIVSWIYENIPFN